MAKKHWRELGSVAQERGKYRAYAYRLLPNGSTLRESKRFHSSDDAWDFINSVKAENEVTERAIKSGQTGDIPTNVRQLMGAYFNHRLNLSEARGKPKKETILHQAQTVNVAVLPALGDAKLVNKSFSKNLSDFQSNLHKRLSEKTGKPLSSSRKRHIMLPLNSALKWGADRGYLEPASLRDMYVPTQQTRNVRERVIPQKEMAKILAYLDKYGCQHSKGICALRWKLAYHMGLRQAETLGLTWSRVNLTSLQLVANQQLKRRPWQHTCTPVESKDLSKREWSCGNQAQYCTGNGKTTNAPKGGGLFLVDGTKTDEAKDKPLPIPQQLISTFIAHQKAQSLEIASATGGQKPTADKSKAKFYQGDDHLVFLQARTLRPYGARHDFTLWENLLTNAGVEEPYRVHDLRHTTATNLASLSNGNTHLIKQMLRHKSTVTSQLYIDPEMDDLRALVNLYGETSAGLNAPSVESGNEEPTA